jgi:hypothetical protein
MAKSLQRDLDISRSVAAELGRSAVEAARLGEFRANSGDSLLNSSALKIIQ